MATISITLNTSWNIYNFRRSLIDDIREAGHIVKIFAPRDKVTDDLNELGYTIIELKKLSRKGTNPINDFQLIKEFEKLYIEHEIDLAIHFTIKPNIFGSIAASRVGIPSIAVVTGLGYTFLSKGLASFASRILYKYAFKRNNVTIFQNPDDSKLFVSSGLVSKSKYKVINGSGINTDHFKSEQLLSKHSNIILFVGRLLFDKGIRELIKGFNHFSKDHPEVELHILGTIDEGNPASLTKDDVDRITNNKIIFHGFDKNVKGYIENADVVILPSYREGLPRTMLEAISMSKPIITTDVPGCREVVLDGINGFLIPAKDSKAITAALIKFYQLNFDEVLKMKNNSRQLALSNFDQTIINKEYLDIIQKCLSQT